jgi:ligand-binding sensor domain-containing protein
VGLLEYDKASGNVTILYTVDQYEANCRRILVTKDGEIWMGTTDNGVFRRDVGGNWRSSARQTLNTWM